MRMCLLLDVHTTDVRYHTTKSTKRGRLSAEAMVGQEKNEKTQKYGVKSAWNISITVSTTGKRTWRKCDTPGKLRKGANLEVDDIVEEVSGATEERLSPAHILSITHHDFK